MSKHKRAEDLTDEESRLFFQGVQTRLAIKGNLPVTHRLRRGKLVVVRMHAKKGEVQHGL